MGDAHLLSGRQGDGIGQVYIGFELLGVVDGIVCGSIGNEFHTEENEGTEIWRFWVFLSQRHRGHREHRENYLIILRSELDEKTH